MRLLLSFVVLLLTFLNSVAVGGWSSRPVDDGNVKEAAKFAVDNEYTKVGGYNSYVIKDAQQQVVAGLNYKMNIDTTLVSGLCESAEFLVYNHFGKLSVTDKKLNPSGCQK